MRYVKKFGRLAAIAALMLVPVVAHAQLNSNVAQVNLSLTVPESITVSASPASIVFTYNQSAGTATASGPINTQINWNLSTSQNLLTFYAFFSSATALTDGTQNIPASEVFAAVNSAGPVAFTGTTPFGNNGVTLGQWSIAANPSASSNPTVNLSMSGLAALTPSTLTGVLNFEAQAL